MTIDESRTACESACGARKSCAKSVYEKFLAHCAAARQPHSLRVGKQAERACSTNPELIARLTTIRKERASGLMTRTSYVPSASVRAADRSNRVLQLIGRTMHTAPDMCRAEPKQTHSAAESSFALGFFSQNSLRSTNYGVKNHAESEAVS